MRGRSSYPASDTSPSQSSASFSPAQPNGARCGRVRARRRSGAGTGAGAQRRPPVSLQVERQRTMGAAELGCCRDRYYYCSPRGAAAEQQEEEEEREKRRHTCSTCRPPSPSSSPARVRDVCRMCVRKAAALSSRWIWGI
ncbi:hypothetical protein ACER0C_024710 [Sarotherodon galilaeus]